MLEEKIKTELENARTALGHPQLYQFLRWKYQGEPILERCKQVYPAVVYAASDSQIRLPDSILLDLQTVDDDKDLLEDSTYRNLRQKTDSKLENRPTFTMKELIIQPDQLGLKCGVGSYFQALDTCDALEWELLSQITSLGGADETDYRQFDRQLSLRSTLHTKVTHPIQCGQHRSVALAVSTLLAYNSEGTLHLLLKRRSASSVAVHSNLFHVIPSFMFQPTTRFLTEEFSVTHNIYREYLEEVFDYPEFAEEAQDWKYFYQDSRLMYLKHLLDTKQAELYLTGITVNLLNLRPEICTLLLIRTPEWYYHHTRLDFPQEQFHLNHEWSPALQSKGDVGPTLNAVPYRATDEELMRVAQIYPGNVVAPGAAAFWLGVDLLRRVL